MLKVNEEKLLHDHAELIEKREEHLAEIEKQATLYAIERGCARIRHRPRLQRG